MEHQKTTDLIHRLAAALQQSVINHDRKFQAGVEVEHWNALLKEVQDLDSVVYNREKCEVAGCVGGEHKCDQDFVIESTALECFDVFRTLGSDAPDTAKQILVQLLSQFTGQLNLGQDRKIIEDKLAEIERLLSRQVDGFAIDANLLHDLKWMHAVAVRGLKLYSIELSRGWCYMHGKQHQFCQECRKALEQQTLRHLASAIKKVCSPETVERLIAEANQETLFVSLLREFEQNNPVKEPPTGVGL